MPQSPRKIRTPSGDGWSSLSATQRSDKALRILITRETNWVNLYNILDVILSDVGGTIWQEGWAPESEIKRLKHTADSENTLGDEARHGRERTQAPADPMSLKEADSFIRSIMRAWLAWKSKLEPRGTGSVQ